MQAGQLHTASELHCRLDGLHGQVLRAKHRLTENPDDAVLAQLVTDNGWLAGQVDAAWRALDVASWPALT